MKRISRMRLTKCPEFPRRPLELHSVWIARVGQRRTIKKWKWRRVHGADNFSLRSCVRYYFSCVTGLKCERCPACDRVTSKKIPCENLLGSVVGVHSVTATYTRRSWNDQRGKRRCTHTVLRMAFKSHVQHRFAVNRVPSVRAVGMTREDAFYLVLVHRETADELCALASAAGEI